MADEKGPIAGCAQVEVRYLLNNQKIENVLHFSYLDSDFDTVVTELSPIIVDRLVFGLAPHLSVQLSCQELYWTDLSAADGATFTYTEDLPFAGTANQDAVSNGVALVLCKRTNKRGRANRGRVFIAGIASSLKANSRFTDAAVGYFLSAYNALRTDAAGVAMPLVIASWAGATGPTFAGHMTTVTDIVNTTPSTRSQRRRNPGIGS